MRIVGILICACWLALAREASGADYFPLAEGVVYEYEYSTHQRSGSYITYFSGTAVIGAQIARVLHYSGDGHDGLLHYWSETPEGDKVYHGYQLNSYPLVFSPPILMIDSPLYVGKTWDVYSRDSDSLATDFHFVVTAHGEVTVPAGTFEAFTIQETVEWPEGGSPEPLHSHLRGVTGTGLTDTSQYVTYYSYADGIGLILYRFGARIDRLLSRRPIAIHPSTWTGVRLLYR